MKNLLLFFLCCNLSSCSYWPLVLRSYVSVRCEMSDALAALVGQVLPKIFQTPSFNYNPSWETQIILIN